MPATKRPPEPVGHPSRHKTLNQGRFNVGPQSTMLHQRLTDIDSTSCLLG